MSLLFIIDGYNIIRHPLFEKKENKKEDRSWRVLFDFVKIKKPQGSLNNKVILVFDGFMPAEDRGFSFDGLIQVLFSRQSSADNKIKMLVEESARRGNIVVVSDDKEVKFMVRSLGARHMSVQDFIEVKSLTRPQRPGDEPKIRLSYAQECRINQELKRLWLK